MKRHRRVRRTLSVATNNGSASLTRRVPISTCLMLLGGIPTHSRQDAPAIRTEATQVRSYDGREAPAELVRLTVAERHDHPGATLTVAALLLSTPAESPATPVFFLMGGPGIPGTEMARVPPYFTLFQRLRESRDVLVLDQRGIGRSEPNLDCPLSGSLPQNAFLSPAALVSFLGQELTRCAAQWRAKGVEPTAYNTLESAEDIDALRLALGFEKIDLLAFSYGTRLALAYVQRHPANVGRIVLQGVNGPGLVVKRPGPIARKLQRIGGRLGGVPGWEARVDLLLAAASARKRLESTPAKVTVTDRHTGQALELPIGREGFDAIAALHLDDARLPALLVSVAAGDDRILTRFVEADWNGLGGGSVGLMARAVNCAADRPDARWELADRESAQAPFGPSFDNAFLTDEFCRCVGYDSPRVEFSRPVRCALPALLLTGELDATNPIENAREVALEFENAVVLEVENAAHELLPLSEVQDVVVAFLAGDDVRGRSIVAPAPRFPTVEQSLQDVPRGR
jgi:pimeloyl-ACP methyl ester carboxylesterase